MADDCSQNIDPLKLVREGTSQDSRVPAALDPASAPANARSVAHNVEFAQAYARFLKHYDATHPLPGDWSDYFGSDVAVPLAIAAIEDVDVYKTAVRSWFDFLNDMDNATQASALKDRLGYLFAVIGSLAQAFDDLQSLPDTIALRGTLQNLVKTQLQPAFARLIGYYQGGVSIGVVNAVAPLPAMQIFRRPVTSFHAVLNAELSADWRTTQGETWHDFVTSISADTTVYGAGGAPDPFTQINHCSTHTLFRSVFDQFLKTLMRVVSEAQGALAGTLNNYTGHAPHYALYLAFLELMEYARTAGNQLTQRHLDFYYRTILGLKEKPAQPGYVHLLAELAKQTRAYDFAPGQLFKAGKDSTGKDAFFANTVDFVANKAAVTSLMSVYRHGSEPVASSTNDNGRIFASPFANSDDGLGTKLTSADQSWQPFFNKVYVDGALSEIKMPQAEVGFAIASHYFLVAEGSRRFSISLLSAAALPWSHHHNLIGQIDCFVTTAKGWLNKTAHAFRPIGSKELELIVELSGADDAVVPYNPKLHGYNFATDRPMLRVALRQDSSHIYAYPDLADIKIVGLALRVGVNNAKTLTVANDFGPIDVSKPFQPFGSSPITGSSLIIGATEIFQKKLADASIAIKWQVPPAVYPATGSIPTANIDCLNAGSWTPSDTADVSIAPPSGSDTTIFSADLNGAVLDQPDYDPNEPYTTQARQGFVRLSLNGDIGQDKYRSALIAFLSQTSTTNPGGTPPQGPIAAALTMNYTASTTLTLSTTSQATFTNRSVQFFHMGPFGTAERHPTLDGGNAVSLLPQFSFMRSGTALPSEAEFYIGISGLLPPQNLSLLLQVSDGTANPLAPKPVPHIDWCYLKANQWAPFPANAVTDATGEILYSGRITFAVPAEATQDNTLLPSGMIWIRAAVSQDSDAVCRLQLVASQAMEAVFSDQGNAPDFSTTTVPPGTITKLATPDSAVKGISQPYPSFGGRGAEPPQDFYRRISERLRHKNRAITLWDYEHMILEEFPQIYKVKCLNHTQYEPADSGGSTSPCSGGIYRELAPGHVTLITLPNLHSQQQLDPLKPYTSLGLLTEVQTFLQQHVSGQVQLHVKNPQFEEVRLSFSLKLHEGYDQSYYTTQLQQAITRFLSPWAFSNTGAPSFDGKIYKSVLINFVEQQPYVDYVTDFKLFQDIPCQAPGTIDLDEVSGSKAVSILVSAPASKHVIWMIDAAANATLAESCGCEA